MLFFNAYAQRKLKNAIKTKTARFQLLSEKTPKTIKHPSKPHFIYKQPKKETTINHTQAKTRTLKVHQISLRHHLARHLKRLGTAG
jgi:IS1 family transposase